MDLVVVLVGKWVVGPSKQFRLIPHFRFTVATLHTTPSSSLKNKIKHKSPHPTITFSISSMPPPPPPPPSSLQACSAASSNRGRPAAERSAQPPAPKQFKLFPHFTVVESWIRSSNFHRLHRSPPGSGSDSGSSDTASIAACISALAKSSPPEASSVSRLRPEARRTSARRCTQPASAAGASATAPAPATPAQSSPPPPSSQGSWANPSDDSSSGDRLTPHHGEFPPICGRNQGVVYR